MMTIDLNDRHLEKKCTNNFRESFDLGYYYMKKSLKYLNSPDSFFKIKPRDLGINTAKLAE